jgi:hypothetical protein
MQTRGVLNERRAGKQTVRTVVFDGNLPNPFGDFLTSLYSCRGQPR